MNAFSRYERGKVVPNTAIRHLLRLLVASDLLEEIKGKVSMKGVKWAGGGLKPEPLFV